MFYDETENRVVSFNLKKWDEQCVPIRNRFNALINGQIFPMLMRNESE